MRGAIDIVLLASELAAIRGLTEPDDERYPATLYDAMIVALSGRIQLEEASDVTPEGVLREIWEDLIVLDSRIAAPG